MQGRARPDAGRARMTAPPGHMAVVCVAAAIGVVEIHLTGLTETVLLMVVAICVLAYHGRRPR